MTNMMTIASTIADDIVVGKVAPEFSVIRQIILEKQANSESQHITLFTYLLIAAWFISIMDILRLKIINK